jgi:hypothetical protein
MAKGYIHLAAHPGGADVIASSDFADQVEILVGSEDDGATTCTITWYRVGGRLRPRVEVFDEDWGTFADAADVFEVLGQQGGSAMPPAEFCEMLDELGYEDITERE